MTRRPTPRAARCPALVAALAAVMLATACADVTFPRRVGFHDPVVTDPAAVDPLQATFRDIEISQSRADWRAGEISISRVPPRRADQFARWFEPRAQTFPPIWVYAAARKLQQGGDYLKAARWYLIGRERHMRHLRRCRDDTAKEQLTWADASFANLRTEMGRNPELTRYVAKHGFAWLDLNRDTEDGLLASCLWGAQGSQRASRGTLVPVDRDGKRVFVLTPPPVADPGNWILPAGEIHQIRTWSRILMKQEVRKILGEPDDLPPTPTTMPLR